MAILLDSNQYKHTGRGPLDAKALVKTYAELLSEDTWKIDNKIVAYNGLVTAVWLNKEDTSKNGLYFLFDPAVTSALKDPDVTNSANWHKLDDSTVDVSNLATKDEIKNFITEIPSEYVTEEELNQVFETVILNGGSANSAAVV